MSWYGGRPVRADSKMVQSYYKVPGAEDSDWTKCNVCGRPFKRRGLTIDMNDFRDHKSNCKFDWNK